VASSPQLALLLAEKALNEAPSSGSSAEKKKPEYVPWSREGFLERLETFSKSVLDFSPKPDEINEVAWAKRGWRCVSPETVGCGSCGRRVLIDVGTIDKKRNGDGQATVDEDDEDEGTREEGDDDSDWRLAAQKDLAQRYEEMIVTGHDEQCCWRRKGCDATIHRLPLTSPASSLEALRTRYESLLDKPDELPETVLGPKALEVRAAFQDFGKLFPSSCSIATIEQQAGSGEGGGDRRPQTAPAPSQITTTNASNGDKRLQAFTLALLGWIKPPPREALVLGGLVSCRACFRRLGLWLWQPRPQSDGSILEACKLEMRVDEEHREYCPWANGISQSASSGTAVEEDAGRLEAGWQILIRQLQNTARSTRRAEDERRPGTAATSTSDVSYEGAADGEALGGREDAESVKAKDKERWAKLKKLKEAFRVRRIKRPET